MWKQGNSRTINVSFRSDTINVSKGNIVKMKTNEKLVLAIDFGTQSVRTSIVNDQGEIKALIKKKYDPPYFSPEPGYVEQDVNYYWQELCNAMHQLREKHNDLLNKVLALSVTTFRDSPVFLDENKEPTRPMILWLDQRQAALHKKLPLLNRLIFWIVGMSETIVLNMKRTPGIWVQENQKEVWAKTKHYVNFSTYINYKLLGSLVDSVANQTGHFPIHFKKQRWYGKNALKNIFQIPPHMLATIVKQGTVLGTISEDVSRETGIPAGIPLIATGTDKGSEALGTGTNKNDEASISYGTASSIAVPNQRYIGPEQFLPAYSAPILGVYHMEVQIYRGYWMVGWFIKQFGIDSSLESRIEELATEEVLNKRMMMIPPGSQGLVLQPYWGPGIKRPEARGAIVGFSDFHTRDHIYRAIVEGIAFGLKEGLMTIERRQMKKVRHINVSGGGSQSDAICQITADIFGLPVTRTQTYETATIGTALATFYYLGVFPTVDQAIKAMVHKEKVFEPNRENHAKYEVLYKEVYAKLYPKLKVIYKSLRKFK